MTVESRNPVTDIHAVEVSALGAYHLRGDGELRDGHGGCAQRYDEPSLREPAAPIRRSGCREDDRQHREDKELPELGQRCRRVVRSSGGDQCPEN